MADLIAKFQLVDEMSDKLSSLAESGQSMFGQWVQAGQEANEAFDGVASTVTGTATTIDGIATSIENARAEIGEIGSQWEQELDAANRAKAGIDEVSVSTDTLTDSMSDFGEAAEAAATQSDYWTEAVGNYSTSALEAIYSTEELVEMGFKSAEALEEQERMFELCEQSATYLSKAIEGSSDIQNELTVAMQQANETISELASNENISAEAKEELEKATTAAAEAMQELNSAQAEATAAMENYDAVIASGTTDLSELEAAAERAYHAADNLAEANGKASSATEELSKSADNAAEEAEKAGEKGINAVEGIAGALAAAGITAMVKEIAEAAYELADAFSEAESTVVKATGASGEALDGLTASMMSAYAASKSGSLEDTAGAIGEINTRMALTGDALTDVTGKFLDFSDITGTDVVGSVQNVTKIMNKWNVEGSEVESVLDKLAYAGQISGVSVDTLSNTLITGAASFQEMGLSLDNAISMLAQFELYGMSGTTAITAMRTAVKNFSDDGLNAETALQSVISEIANMETAADATALAVDTFGSRAGVDMANAIRSGALSVDTLTSSLEVAQGTVKNTAATAQTLEQKWEQATGNISTAFTKTVQPVLDEASSGFAEMANSLGDFLNEHPTATKLVTALGVGIGVVAVGVAGVAAASLTAIPAVAALGTAINAAIWPITAVAAAIAGITAAILILGEEADISEEVTMRTREQESELERLNEEYDEACSKYGKTSEEAGELALKISQLEEEYANNAETIGEFVAKIEESGESIENRFQSYQDSIEEISDLSDSSTVLVSELLALSGQSDKTGSTLDMMGSIVDKLNSNYEDFGLTLDKTTGKLNVSASDLYNYIEKAAEQEKKQAAMDSLTEALSQFGDVKEQSEQAAQEVAKAWDNYEALEEKWKGEHPILKNIAAGAEMNWSSDLGVAFDEWEALSEASSKAHSNYEELVGEIKTYCEEIGYSAEETDEFISQLESSAEAAANFSEQMDSTGEDTVSSAEAAASAYEGVRAEIEELCTAYDEAYQSAIESFEGQFGLFDEASTKSEEYLNATVENAQKAINSQLEYWESYSADVETLRSTSAADLGITQENYEALMSYAQDGSEQAAGLAHSIASAIKQGDEEAVATLANTVGKVEAKQSEIARTTADWQTDFTEKMNQYVSEMEETVGKMDLSPEAAKAATSTINSYANSIRAGKGGAVAAAQEVAHAVTAALQSANTSVNVKVNGGGTVPGHAAGTTNAENVFVAGEAGPELIVSKAAAYATGTTDSDDFYIAGENGPELIVGQQGSTVFPTEETDRIINSLSDRERSPISITAETGGDTGNSEGGTGEQVKRIFLEIAGSGAIEVGKGADKESILEVLTDHIKPVLLNLLQQEIYEEGDLSYDF